MATTLRPLRVLIADDECAIGDSLAIIFRQNGFDAAAVYSGYSAIETAARFYPDVVISDIDMPGVNGVDAALSISRQLPNSKFLLITGYSDCEFSISQARAHGLQFKCLQKPVPPQVLIEYLIDCALHLDANAHARKLNPDDHPGVQPVRNLDALYQGERQGTWV